jgi:hypothetical protein
VTAEKLTFLSIKLTFLSIKLSFLKCILRTACASHMGWVAAAGLAGAVGGLVTMLLGTLICILPGPRQAPDDTSPVQAPPAEVASFGTPLSAQQRGIATSPGEGQISPGSVARVRRRAMGETHSPNLGGNRLPGAALLPGAISAAFGHLSEIASPGNDSPSSAPEAAGPLEPLSPTVLDQPSQPQKKAAQKRHSTAQHSTPREQSASALASSLELELERGASEPECGESDRLSGALAGLQARFCDEISQSQTEISQSDAEAGGMAEELLRHELSSDEVSQLLDNLRAGERALSLRYRLFTPEVQWQSRGQRRI